MLNNIRSIQDFKNYISSTEEIKSEFEKSPMEMLNQVPDVPPMNDKKIFKLVVILVGAIALSSLLFGCFLYYKQIDLPNAKVPEFVISFGSMALGALVGLLAPNHNQ